MRVDGTISSYFTAAGPPSSAAKAGGATSGKAVPQQGSSVTISDAARKATAGNTGGRVSDFRIVSLQNAADDADYAKRVTREFADDTWAITGPMVNLNTEPITFSFTGEVATPQRMAAFKADAAQVRSEKMAVYRQEKDKGTPDVEILRKLYGVVDQQSADYRRLLNWPGEPI